MKISYDWLLQYITTSASIDTISETLTEIGLEIEGVENLGEIQSDLDNIVVAEVQEVHPHPNADKLKLCKVFDGTETYQIVCGASNVKDNQKVALAKIGAELTFKNGDKLKIKKSKIRGEESYGMLCAEDELGLSDNHDGIMKLNEYAMIGTPLREYLEYNDDYTFEIGLTPNRSDAMSHYGVARDLHAGMQLRGIKSEFHPFRDEFILKNDAEPTFKVVLENDQCKRYCLAHIEDISVQDSPKWLQTKLRAIGLEPINNVVDVTNYILHSFGQPLHAFDASKVKGNTVIVGNNDDDTLFTTLDKNDRKLNSEDLMIKNGENEPMCIAGVFGGLESGVTENTTSIVLESAYFDPVAVRKTAKRHGLNTDASFRFERGVDPDLTLLALKKATELIVELGTGNITEKFIDVNHLSPNQSPINVRFARVNQIIGNDIPKDKIKEIFGLLDIHIQNENEERYSVIVPAYRTDVMREIDVIEEILRIYGYNKITVSDKISFSLQNQHEKKYGKENEVSHLLASNGYYEVMNNSLNPITEGNGNVYLLNPLSQDLAEMRTSMLDGILTNIQYNINRSNSDLKFFEWGKTYKKKGENYVETPQLALALTGNFQPESWTVPSSKSTFFELKGMAEAVFNRLGIEFQQEDVDNENFEQALRYKSCNRDLGIIGKVDSSKLKEYGIKQEVWFAQLNWEAMYAEDAPETFELQPISKFPGSRRDLALLLNQSIEYKDLKETAFEVNNVLLKSVNLFDVYEGKNLPEGKKSYALSYEFMDDSQTIKDTQVDEIIQKIVKKYQTEYGAELRA